MKLIRLLSILAILGLVACNSDRIYESHNKNFKNYRWDKDRVLEFTPAMSDTIGEYKVYLALRHVYGFQFESVKVKVTSTSPSGKTEVNNYELHLIAKDNTYLSVCAEDICDLEVIIEEHKVFKEIGTYTYAVEHLMSVDYLPNVMEFGLIIEKYPADQ